MATMAEARERPGCVTIYAVLAVLGGASGALFVPLILLPALAGDRGSLVFLAGVILCGGVLSLFPISMAVGLWRMRAWGWWLAVIFQSVGIMGALFNIVVIFLGGGLRATVLWVLSTGLGLIVGAGVLYWFVTNRRLFGVGGAEEDGPATGMAGWIVVLIAIIGVVICLLPVVLIAVMTLLGPEIEEVFSEILRTLSAP